MPTTPAKIIDTHRSIIQSERIASSECAPTEGHHWIQWKMATAWSLFDASFKIVVKHMMFFLSCYNSLRVCNCDWLLPGRQQQSKCVDTRAGPQKEWERKTTSHSNIWNFHYSLIENIDHFVTYKHRLCYHFLCCCCCSRFGCVPFCSVCFNNYLLMVARCANTTDAIASPSERFSFFLVHYSEIKTCDQHY